MKDTSRSWCRGYGLAGLAILATFSLAIAACGSGPGAKAQADPVKIIDVFFVDGETIRRISLADKFSVAAGEELTYTATSSNTSVATVAVDNAKDVLTVTVRGAGTATITVTAADSQERTATQTFRVTVPEPEDDGTEEEEEQQEEEEEEEEEDPPPPKPQEECSLSGSSLTITVRIIRENNKRCTLPAEHSLVPPGPEVRVRADSSPPPNVWTITAIDKGRHVVQVRKDESGDTVGEITVIVPNTPPQLDPSTSTVPRTITIRLGSTTLHDLELADLASSFTDVDDTDTDAGVGIFNYKVQHKPDELLIKTVRGFLLEKNSSSVLPTIDAVVLKPFTEAFSIEVYAYDRDNARSDNPVTVNFTAPVATLGGSYQLVKGTGNSYNKTEKIGNRLGIDHTIDLKTGDYDVFDHVKAEAATTILRRNRSGSTDMHTIEFTECVTSVGAFNSGCWKATISGTKVGISGFVPSANAADAQVLIKLDPTRSLTDASDSTITISYYVVTGRDAANLREMQVGSGRRITVDIHRCVNTADCP